MISISDHIRLWPLMVEEKVKIPYLLSKELAIRLICPDLERTWLPMSGEPIVGRLRTSFQLQSLVSEETI